VQESLRQVVLWVAPRGQSSRAIMLQGDGEVDEAVELR
jgi:hypothetical protein